MAGLDNTINCAHCGHIQSAAARICESCGAPMATSAPAPQRSAARPGAADIAYGTRSTDGQWWWNGASWMPTTPAPSPAAYSPRRQVSWRTGVAGGCGGVVLIGAVVTGIIVFVVATFIGALRSIPAIPSAHTPQLPLASFAPVPVGQLVDVSAIPSSNGLQTVTVHGFETGITSAAISPKPGNVYAAADVEACASPAGATNGIDGFDFYVELPDQTRRLNSDAPVRTPLVTPGPIAAGRCVRAFVVFEVPTGSLPTTVAWNPALNRGVTVRWAVSSTSSSPF